MTHRTHFDRIASKYETSLPPHITNHYRKKRIKLIKSLLNSGSVLDTACGTGNIVESLTEEGLDAFGTDLSIEMLKISIAKSHGLYVLANTIELPFPSNIFDLVLSIATLHHLADPSIIRKAIYEMLRVVRSGGYLLIWDHNPNNPYWKFLMRRVPQDCGNERLINHKEILDILNDCRTVIDSIKFSHLSFIPDFLPVWLLPWAQKVEVFLEKSPIINRVAAHNVFLIKKI